MANKKIFVSSKFMLPGCLLVQNEPLSLSMGGLVWYLGLSGQQRVRHGQLSAASLEFVHPSPKIHADSCRFLLGWYLNPLMMTSAVQKSAVKCYSNTCTEHSIFD